MSTETETPAEALIRRADGNATAYLMEAGYPRETLLRLTPVVRVEMAARHVLDVIDGRPYNAGCDL